MKTAKPQQKTLWVDGKSIPYELTRKKIKNMNIRISPKGEVRMSVPQWVSERAAESFLQEKAAWVTASLARWEASQTPPAQFQTGESLRILGREVPLTVREGSLAGVRLEGDTAVLTAPKNNTPESRRRIAEKWLGAQALTYYQGVLDRLYPLIAPFGCHKPQLCVRKMRTRWGSCIPTKGKITLSLNLFSAPTECVDYVMLHELCHLKHPNHGQGFYRMLASLLPDWKERKRILNQTVKRAN